MFSISLHSLYSNKKKIRNQWHKKSLWHIIIFQRTVFPQPDYQPASSNSKAKWENWNGKRNCSASASGEYYYENLKLIINLLFICHLHSFLVVGLYNMSPLALPALILAFIGFEWNYWKCGKRKSIISIFTNALVLWRRFVSL